MIDAKETLAALPRYVFGMDWGTDDKRGVTLSLALVRHNEHGEGEVVRRYDARFANTNEVIHEVKRLNHRWQPSLVMIETNGIGQMIVDRLIADGVPVRGFQVTHRSKEQLIAQMRETVRAGLITMPTDQYFRAAYGDDLDLPLALAIQAIREKQRPPVTFT
jgi:hypothetical protein